MCIRDSFGTVMDPSHTAMTDVLVVARNMDVPGFTGDAYRRWPHGLAFYYASASTQAFVALQVNPGSGITQALLQTQRRDGSWANPENLVKEDDPLIATSFAVRALALSARD